MAGTKRKHEYQSNEVYKNSAMKQSSVEAKIDPTYGQRSAIPLGEDEADGGEDGEHNYDEEMDALEYLRSVRREANGIPNLLVAPKTPPPSDSRAIYEDGVGDYRGRYADGAFYAADDSEYEEESWQEDDLRMMYYKSILTRYQKLRDELHQVPPPEVFQALNSSLPTYVHPINATRLKFWRWNMRTVDPVPAQVASMDKDTVLRLVSVLAGGSMLKIGREVEIGVSRWAWCLLAKLPERGELNSEEIGIIRELGKKAVLVGVGLTAEKSWEEGMQGIEAGYEDEADDEPLPVENDDEISLKDVEVPDTDKGVQASSQPPEPTIGPVKPIADGRENGSTPAEDSTAGEDFIAAKARLLNTLDEGHLEINIEPEIVTPRGPTPELEEEGLNSRINTKATLDMIVTVAGEVYGQRDLLEFREQWSDL